MSGVNLPAMAECVTAPDDKKQTIAMEEVNAALKECGFGLFHIRLLISAFVALVNGVIISIANPYVLPVAECDLNMNLVEKGILNASPFVGMVASSIIAGFLTDAFGRKRFILIGYEGLFVFMFISGLSQNYIILATAKFFEGLFFATAFSPTLTLTSEFCHHGIRDIVMLLQASFMPLGQVIVALKSWLILSHDWKISFFDGYFVLHTWNIYYLALSLWPLLVCILYAFIPESPKFHVTLSEYDKAREILTKIYKENTRKPANTFKYVDLWCNRKSEEAINEKPQGYSSITEQICAGFQNIKPIFQKPLLWSLILICTLNFFTLKLYNIIIMWFPQLSAIVENYSRIGSNDLCVMLDAYTRDSNSRAINANNGTCVPVRSGTESYINNVILGTVCFLALVISGMVVNKVGKRNLFIAYGIVTTALTLALRWANSKASIVTLFSLDGAITQAMASLTQAMVVEVFPTSIKSLAMSIVMTCGRVGSVTLLGFIIPIKNKT
ncbi:unnamed protein product [Leptidea sinapis]|uniref:Major facilitator superfamily (MFS) profile domain-containing protein n=1 Tax=Leptidea sinapis TaxID=189913 RepID=A0A5E4QLJ4_9NEOP|nr:unnamed protein product [Leptidea sinapis]